MKLTIRNQEVEIKVKDAFGKYSQKETECLLNVISIAFSDAGKWNECQGYPGIANAQRNNSIDIYEALREIGFYDKLEEKYLIQSF